MNALENTNNKLVENIKKEFDLIAFTSSKSKGNNRKYTRSGYAGMVNTKDHGKRFTMSDELMENLNFPEQVYFSFSDNAIAISGFLPNNDNPFFIRKSGKKSVVYSSKLVEEITQKYNLNFDGITSITFYDADFTEHDGYPVVIIKMD